MRLPAAIIPKHSIRKAVFFLLSMILLSCNDLGILEQEEESIKDSTATTAQKQSFAPDSAEMLQKLQAYVYDSTIYDTYLPVGVKNYLATHLQDWQLPHPELWDALWFQSYKKPDALVNLISGDFNCDGQTDYALLLSHKRDSTIGAWVIQPAAGGYNAIKLEDLEKPENHISLGLELIEKGEQNYIDPNSNDTLSLKLECPAVQVTYFEKGATTYYWNKGEYNGLQTGD